MALPIHGRFYDSYGASMDAALSAKIADLEPWLVEGLIVDRGCGTGALLDAMAKRGWKTVGIDMSPELSKSHAGVILADVSIPVFASNFVSNIILSSVLHEVYSYASPPYSLGAVTECLSNSLRELKIGGRIIIRDIWSPEDDSSTSLALQFSLENWQLFRDFFSRCPFPLKIAKMHDSSQTVAMSTRAAVEFLSKKDYPQHWDLELAEEYCALPLSFYDLAAKDLGMKVVHSSPVRNSWIIENRWSSGVKGKLPAFTNQIVVMEKTQ